MRNTINKILKKKQVSEYQFHKIQQTIIMLNVNTLAMNAFCKT